MNAALDWNSIYLTCFIVGLVLSILTFATGVGHLHIGHFHIGHGHVGHHGAGARHGSNNGFSVLNGFTLVVFLCWFGGTGYLLHRYSGFVAPLILGLATLGGLVGGALIFFYMTKILLPMERYLEPADTEMAGVIGKLSGGIPLNGVGEILFSQNGSRRCANVRSDDGTVIERGTEVVVMRYERGIGYVRRWDEFEHGLTGEQNVSRIEDKTMRD